MNVNHNVLWRLDWKLLLRSCFCSWFSLTFTISPKENIIAKCHNGSNKGNNINEPVVNGYIFQAWRLMGLKLYALLWETVCYRTFDCGRWFLIIKRRKTWIKCYCFNRLHPSTYALCSYNSRSTTILTPHSRNLKKMGFLLE